MKGLGWNSGIDLPLFETVYLLLLKQAMRHCPDPSTLPCSHSHSLTWDWHSPSDRNQGALSCSLARELGQPLIHLQSIPTRVPSQEQCQEQCQAARSNASPSPQSRLAGWQRCSSDKQSAKASLLPRVKSWTWASHWTHLELCWKETSHTTMWL